MPLYEYRCTACHHAVELHHAVGGTPGPCPVCGGVLQRIFSSIGVIFKGSGFHSTDYRRPAASEPGQADGAKARPSQPGPSKAGEGATSGGGASSEAGAKEH